MKSTASLFALLMTFVIPSVLASGTARIVGTIQDPGATYSGLCWIVVIPCTRMPDCATGSTPKVVEAATLREFEISDLDPGLYKVAVISSGDGAWASPTFSLPEGQTATLSPVLTRDQESNVIVFEQHNRKDLEGYSDLLYSLDEPPLCAMSTEGSSPHEHYRVIWERAFHPPIVVRLTVFGADGFTARFKQGSGDSYEDQELAVDEVTNIVDHLVDDGFSEEEALEFREKISGQASCDGFWDLPFAIEDGSLVLDGSWWTVEGVKNGECHVVKRRSPDRGDPIREFAWDIIRYTGRQFIYEEVY
jgi:hypothetical protein